jgi:hypothetical protein
LRRVFEPELVSRTTRTTRTTKRDRKLRDGIGICKRV